MINKRINKIIKENGINVNKFSQKIGVNRSTMSHILSGRNNPSIDLINKILDNFNEINPTWLLRGSGSMYLPDLNFDPKIYKEVKKVLIFYTDNSFRELNP